MIRLIAKWYISRSIDCNRAMPGWVEREMDSDSSLKEFYRQSQKLAVRLRTTRAASTNQLGHAINGGVDLAARFANVRRDRTMAPLTILAIGLAAIILLSLAPFSRQPVTDKLLHPTEFTKAASPNMPPAMAVDPNRLASGYPDAEDSKAQDSDEEKADQLRKLMTGGRRLVQILKQQASNAEPALEVGYDQLSTIASLEVDEMIRPVSDLGTSYGALLSNFDHHVESKNRRLISDGIGAWNFFLQKLPSRTASLAGL